MYSLLFVLQKAVLYRNDLCVGIVYWILASWLELGGCLWMGAALAERLCACVTPFCSFHLEPEGSEQYSWKLAGRPKHRNRAPPCPIKVEGDVNNGAYQHLWFRGFSQLFESSYGFPAFSIWSLPPVCCSEAVHSTLSCLSGVIALYTFVYLNLLVGWGEFGVLLLLPYKTSLKKFIFWLVVYINTTDFC